MRYLHLILPLLLLNLLAGAQKYGNEWIKPTQQYFKFPVAKEGVYKIDSTTLAGYFNLSTVNPKNFQLFIKGKERFLYIKGEADNKINTGDYLEFYYEGRPGDVDSMLYHKITYLPNPYKSLFNDTLYGYLTLNNLVNNQRYTIETDTNSAAWPAANYFYHEKVWAPYNNYNRAVEFPEDGASAVYTQNEAFGRTIYAAFGSIDSLKHKYLALNVYTVSASNTISLSYNAAGEYKTNYAYDHRFRSFYTDGNGNWVMLQDTTFLGPVPFHQTYTLNPRNFADNGSIVFSPIPVTQFINTPNFVSIFYTRLYYPHTLNLNNKAFYTLDVANNNGSSKLFYNLSNVNAGTSTEMFDVTNGKYITTVNNGTYVRAVIPDGAIANKRCVLVNSDSVIKVSALKKVETAGYFTRYISKTATKPFLIVYPPHLASSANNYKVYRESSEGGAYNVILADASKVYDQFNYGVNKHPLAIKNLIKLLNDSLPVPPKYVLLLGHGVHPHELTASALHASNNQLPGIGSPASDQLYTAALSDTNIYVPQIPIGRIAAYNNTQVNDYLSKVKEHENVSDTAIWKKKVLHFVGGDDEALVNNIAGFMNVYKGIIEDTLFGGKVTSFRKNTTAPIQTNINDSVYRIINAGSSILTFFGHGHAYGFDQAIDNMNRYSNTGRYPFVIANSCNSGDLYIFNNQSISQTFVLTPKKGSVGFIAPTSFGFDQNMFTYTRELYKAIAKTKYGLGIGDAVKQAIYENRSQDIYQKVVAMDFALHADPSISFNVGTKPDFVLENKDVNFDQKKYTDSLGLIIRYRNAGAARSGSLAIKVIRYFPNGDSAITFLQNTAAHYVDTLKFFMPTDFNKGYGLNRFKVMVDYFNQFAEKNENNNNTFGTVDLFITGGDIYPVYPYYFAVVPKTNTITLKASTSDPFAPLTSYRFQLDTCDKFTAPVQSTVITSKGGVIEWNINLPYADSTVYFWRVSRDSINAQTPFVWRESSFQTINTKRGWGQAHFHQFKSDQYQFVQYRKDLRKFTFSNAKINISTRDGFYPAVYYASVNYYYNSIRMAESGCAVQGWNIAVFDSISCLPKRVYAPQIGIFGPDSNCYCNKSMPFYSFGYFAPTCSPFNLVPFWKKHLEDFLNSIPNNNYVLAYMMNYDYNNSPQNVQVSTYSNGLYSAFESIGAKRIRTLSDSVPYILFGRKGMTVGQGHETIGSRRNSLITQEDTIVTRWRNGFVASEKIGPSYKWNSLHWRVKSLESANGDSTVLKVIGYRKDGGVDTLATFPTDSTDVLDLANYANASQYPFLQLLAFMQDKVYTTAPQLQRWQVLYDEAPECAINPLKGFASINDSLQEGDVVTFRFPIENIGVKNMEDSLLTTYWIDDNQHNKVLLKDKLRKGPFVPGQVIIDTVKVNSYQLMGNNALWIHVNPVNHKKYQYEQFQLNNVGRYAFKVTGDVINPLLDVTFDGVRILNGDIVSSRPNILITLKDENKFLALNDTSAFSIYLQAPGQSQQQPIYFAQGLVFTPASLPKNSCSILYTPLLLVDGRYTLVVQAKDRSRNVSGYNDYRIQFEINNKPSITSVLNYPNPFTTSTRFVFTLTGSEVPEVFTIQIMTVSGKVVREITREELGNLHIGRNITDYAWDGKDMYGDRLANGVYLYRVITRLNGSTIDKSASDADKYFTKEYGKMVIMR